jgi:hypothetical protein
LDASRINSSMSALGAYSFAAAQRAYGVGNVARAGTPSAIGATGPTNAAPIAKIGDAVRATGVVAPSIQRGGDSVAVEARASAVAEVLSERLVAAVVPGRIDFSQEQPTQNTAGALPFYRHPADKNSAATRIAVSTKIDVNA